VGPHQQVAPLTRKKQVCSLRELPFVTPAALHSAERTTGVVGQPVLGVGCLLSDVVLS
jgi:hypothetical protein